MAKRVQPALQMRMIEQSKKGKERLKRGRGRGNAKERETMQQQKKGEIWKGAELLHVLLKK